MAVTAADGDASSGLTKMRTRRRDEKQGGHVPLFLLTILCLFAASVRSQDLRSFERAIRSGTSEQKRDALYEIKKISTEYASRIAVPALNDTDVMVRSTAASAVVYLPADEALPLLQPLLSDKQEFVRREAAYALGTVGDPRAVPMLVERLEKDKGMEVRTASAIALGEIGDTAALMALTAILQKKPSEETEFLRRSAARSIGQIALRQQFGSTRTLTPHDFLPAKFKKIPGELRDLAQGSGPDFKNALAISVKVLESTGEAADTRREAAFAIGAIGSQSAVAILSKYSSDPDPYLAEICREALQKYSR